MDEQGNRLVDALSHESRRQLLLLARRVDLPQRAVLFRPEEASRYVYFLTSGIASYVVTLPHGGAAEVGLQGTEGAIGAMDLMGASAAVAQCFMQTNGTALRVPMNDMRKVFLESGEVRRCILESVQQQALTLTQIGACNKLHSPTERLSRWLLTASDRTGSASVSLTQETLAAMLGTRRTTIAMVAGSLQRSGMIQYSGGTVKIVDREALMAAACDCYCIEARLVRDMYRSDPSRMNHSGMN